MGVKFHLYVKWRVGRTGAKDTDFEGATKRDVGNQLRSWLNQKKGLGVKLTEVTLTHPGGRQEKITNTDSLR